MNLYQVVGGSRERYRETGCKIPLYNLDNCEQPRDQSLSQSYTTVKLPLCIKQSSNLEPMPFDIIIFINIS